MPRAATSSFYCTQVTKDELEGVSTETLDYVLSNVEGGSSSLHQQATEGACCQADFIKAINSLDLVRIDRLLESTAQSIIRE